VVASVDPGSDTAFLLQQSGAGLCVQAGDNDSLAGVIAALKNDKEARVSMGEKGRRHALEHHSPEGAAKRFEELLQAIQ
jgi:glycosyltransferase involved in cell wall biosynthesis